MSTHNHTTTKTTKPEAMATTDSHGANPEEITAVLGDAGETPLRSMLNHSRRVTYDQHDVIYHQGSPARSVSFIISGLVKLIVHLPNGRARIVRFHRTGSVLGLGGLYDRNNEHTVVALTPVTVLRLPLSAVQRLRREDTEMYLRLVERWHDYLRDADIWITQFSTGPIRGRVARLLSFLTDFNRESPNDQLHLLTCEEMGAVLGVTSESTSRILAEFKRDHIIFSNEDQPHEIYNADLGRLLHIAEQA